MISHKQWISHKIKLGQKVGEEKIETFEIEIALLVVHSLIATDIRTGFPVLASDERQEIDWIINQQFNLYKKENDVNSSQLLIWLSGFVEVVEKILVNHYEAHPDIDFDSMAINISLNSYVPMLKKD